MNRRSVGTISMAFLFIISGIFILIYTFISREYLKYFFMIAPVSLIMLGCEVLYNSYLLDNKETMKINALSVLITFIYVIFSLLFYEGLINIFI